MATKRKRKVKKRDYKPITSGEEAVFKKNGGYFMDGKSYMDCRQTGEPVANVSLTSTSVLGSIALTKKCISLLSETERKKLFGVSTNSSRLSRPRGWRWMAEFVDSEGNVFVKGVEKPKLKGSLPVTDVGAIKARQKANKEKRKIALNKDLLKMAAEKKELKKAIDAQKDFLDHKAGK